MDVVAGRRYGRWTVVAQAESRRSRRMVKVVCECGAEAVVVEYSLTAGTSQSCGCLRRERSGGVGTHGHTSGGKPTPTYYSWNAMMGRCNHPSVRSYNRYGGRGITVCDRWRGKTGFQNFLADMGERPDRTTLDRIDNDGNYEPGNCRWATGDQQRANKSHA